MRVSSGLRPLSALILVSSLTIACSDDSTGPDDDPLAGLAQRTGSDSLGNPLPPPPANPTPGTVRGTVLGPSTGSGGDTLATAPRVSGVVVRAHKIIGGTQADPELADAEQPATTGADGKFSLTLTGGNYVVTFTPPASSAYRGIWVTGSTSSISDDYPWWIILPNK